MKCKHEFRQKFRSEQIGSPVEDWFCLVPDGYYCIKCLLNVNDKIITQSKSKEYRK